MPVSGGVASISAPRMPLPERTGQSDAPEGTARTRTLLIMVKERPGSVDRVIGLLRRRRANLQTLTIGRTERPDVARITAVTTDAAVAFEQLVEQLHKVVDVQQVTHLLPERMVERELALIKVTNDAQHSSAILELGHQFGAHVIDMDSESVTLEVTSNIEQVEKLIHLLESFGIREVARTGGVAISHSTTIVGAQ